MSRTEIAKRKWDERKASNSPLTGMTVLAEG